MTLRKGELRFNKRKPFWMVTSMIFQASALRKERKLHGLAHLKLAWIKQWRVYCRQQCCIGKGLEYMMSSASSISDISPSGVLGTSI